MANDGNLKRGKQPGKKHDGRKNLVPGAGPSLNELKARAIKDERDVRERVREDPMQYFEYVAEELAVLSHKLLKDANRKRAGEVPERVLMETLRELRQTLEKVNEYRALRGAAAQADEWFAEVDTRLEVLAAGLAEGLRPALEVPA